MLRSLYHHRHRHHRHPRHCWVLFSCQLPCPQGALLSPLPPVLRSHLGRTLGQTSSHLHGKVSEVTYTM